ncbi:hypothetical protein [Candidatus Korobacter versatilis]|nr:hypothetical protein [Candidatus Koribacter versatilis]
MFLAINAVIFLWRMFHGEVYGKFRRPILVSYACYVIVALLPMLFVSSDANYLLIVMYFLWGLYAYVLAQCMFRNHHVWKVFLRVTNRTTIAVLAAGALFGIYHGEYFMPGSHRLAFVFFIVQYGYALCVVCATALGLAINNRSERAKTFYAVEIIICMVLMALAVSRSSLVFALVMVLTYWVLKSDLALGWGLALVILVAGGTGVTFDILGWDKVNDLSSGRLALYEYELNTHLLDRPVDEWLLGSSTFLQSQNTLVVDEAGKEARFKRNQTDNAYLSMLLSHGMLGLFFFATPLLLLAQLLLKSGKSAPPLSRSHYQLGFAVWMAVAMTSLSESTLPSLGGIVPIYMPIFWMPIIEFCPWRPSYAKTPDPDFVTSVPVGV